jgi:hypothetical protein
VSPKDWPIISQLRRLWSRDSRPTVAREKGTIMGEEGGSTEQAMSRLGLHGLSWLADAPMFIDSEQVASFYDAIARPETKLGAIETSTTLLSDIQAKFEGKVEAGLKLPKLLQMFPFVDAEAKAGLGGSVNAERRKEEVQHAEYLPIETPQRELVRLAFHYATNLDERTLLVSETDFPGPDWSTDEFSDFIRLTPRALAFLDFPRKTIFIPFAAEVANGQVVLIFKRLIEMYSRAGEPLPPPYPGTEAPAEGETVGDQRQAYFGWFATRMAAKPNLATIAVEEAITAGGGRVQWIDYRVPLNDANHTTLHLHVSGRGAYDTGTFAYNLVQRGFKHGLRIIGTLKSEPDLNVLAIFEK